MCACCRRRSRSPSRGKDWPFSRKSPIADVAHAPSVPRRHSWRRLGIARLNPRASLAGLEFLFRVRHRTWRAGFIPRGAFSSAFPSFYIFTVGRPIVAAAGCQPAPRERSSRLSRATPGESGLRPARLQECSRGRQGACATSAISESTPKRAKLQGQAVSPAQAMEKSYSALQESPRIFFQDDLRGA